MHFFFSVNVLFIVHIKLIYEDVGRDAINHVSTSGITKRKNYCITTVFFRGDLHL